MSKHRRFTPAERQFVEALCRYARIEDMADALGRRWRCVNDHYRKRGLPGRQRGARPPLSRVAVLLAWRELSTGGEMPDLERLRLVDSIGQRGRATPDKTRREWSEADVMYMLENVGYMPLAEIARRLGRTLTACSDRMKGMEHGLFTRGPVQLSEAIQRERGLRVYRSTIQGWIARGLVRAWKEQTREQYAPRRVQIHRDDFDWLVENYRWLEPFQPYPGYEPEELDWCPLGPGQGCWNVVTLNQIQANNQQRLHPHWRTLRRERAA